MTTATIVTTVIVLILVVEALVAIGVTMLRERQLVAQGEQPLPTSSYVALLLRIPVRIFLVLLIAPATFVFTGIGSVILFFLWAYIGPILLAMFVEKLIFAITTTYAIRKETKRYAEKLSKEIDQN